MLKKVIANSFLKNAFPLSDFRYGSETFLQTMNLIFLDKFLLDKYPFLVFSISGSSTTSYFVNRINFLDDFDNNQENISAFSEKLISTLCKRRFQHFDGTKIELTDEFISQNIYIQIIKN